MTGSRERPYLGAGDENLRRGRAAPPPRASARAGFGGAIPPRAGGAAFLGGQRPLAGGPGSAARFPARWPLPRSSPPVSPHRRGARRCLRGRGGGGRTQPKIPALQTSSTSSGPQDDLGTPEITLNGVGGGGGGGLGRKSSESPPVLEQVRTP